MVQVDAGLYALAFEHRELDRGGVLGALSPRQPFADRALDHGSESLVRIGGKALDLAKEPIIQAQRRPHTSKHIMHTSICQLKASL